MVLTDPQKALLEQAEAENLQQRLAADLRFHLDDVLAQGLEPGRARRVVYERTHAV